MPSFQLLQRVEAALRKLLREHDQKEALSSDIKKVEISLEFKKKLGYVSASNLRPSKFESHALATKPRMLKFPKNLARNNAATCAYKLTIRCSKSKFACKNLACNKSQRIKPYYL